MRVAVVGSGVSGLVAARELHRARDITVFEADRRVGGHVHTWTLHAGGRSWPVDSGFIVYNERNYPRFTRLLAELGVGSRPSTMGFSVRSDRTGLEYSGSSLRGLFVQPRNVVNPAFLRMLADILRFDREAPRAVRRRPAGEEPLGALLERGRYSRAFREWYIQPMASAIWSVPLARVLEMPAAFFVRFFENHGLLTLGDRPRWRVVRGGSARYVDALVAPFRDRIRVGRRVRRVARFADRVEVDGEPFDRVVLACHSDQVLELLADPTAAEREVLGALPYQVNDAVVHTDVSMLPRSRAAWASWNYRLGGDPAGPATLTYNMNILQSLDAPETFCVTLNGGDAIDPARVLGRVRYHHPVYTVAGEAARRRRGEISGPNRTHYCGAYWGNGFHEDGVVSGLAAAREIGAAARAEVLAAVPRAPARGSLETGVGDGAAEPAVAVP
ncbi:MAG TPA: FAD-dependent oxidoreductase [Gemmatimonadales bacterium]|nr:FAD-dependent oxidoreductase [Gemmatimonadales bacterium]